MKHLLSVVMLLISFSVFSQDGKESLKKGMDAQENSKYKQAETHLKEASNVFQKNKDIENYLLAQSLLGFNLLKTNNPRESVKLLEQNILESQRASSKANFWEIQNNYYIAEAELVLGNYKKAEELVQKNIDALTKTKEYDLLAKNYNLLGIIFWEQDNSNLAIQYIEKGLEIRETNGLENLGASYNDLGLVYQDIDIEKSLFFYNKALESYDKIYPEIHSKNAILLSNIALIEVEKKQYEKAEQILKRSKDIWEKIYPEQNHPSEAYVINNLGRVFLEQKQYSTAESYFKEALKMYQENYQDKHPEIATTYNLIAQTFFRKGKFKNALLSVQRALAANSIDFNSLATDYNPSSKSIFSTNIFLSSLTLKSKILKQQYISKTLRLSDLKNALECLKIADTLLNTNRYKASSKADKLLLAQNSAQTYEEAVILCNLLANETLQYNNYYSQAFYFSEKAKAIILLEAINESKAKKFGNIPDDLLKKEEKLKTNINFLEQQTALKSEPKRLDNYKSELFILNREYESLQEKLENEYPEYYDLKYSIKPVEIENLQSKLDENTLILDYMVGTDQLFVFMIEAKKIKLVSFDKDPDFASDIIYLLNSIQFDLLDEYSKIARKIYKDIFPKRISPKIKNIVVIQDGKLATLPMEVLIHKSIRKKDDINYTNLEVLLKKWTFSYAYSATLWYQNSDKKILQNKQVALFAPISFESNVRLTASEKEVNQIARLCEQKKIETTMFVNEKASEENIKGLSNQNYAIMHFATHGLVNEEDPELSQIFLQRSGNEDGNLFAGEVFNLRLNADLVTLSACEVGLGKINKGEGVIGLGRAFLYAGADNLVLSLWKVSDESTSELMIYFYEQKLANPSMKYAEAMQNAKLKLLNDKRFSAPYYWAAFLVLGR